MSTYDEIFLCLIFLQTDGSVTFQVQQNKRYRFRLAYAGGDVKCPISCSIEDHKLLIIALDGNAIQPVYASKFILVPGKNYFDTLLLYRHLPNL